MSESDDSVQLRKDFFYRISPSIILDCAELQGARATGRFQALNSYENRVYEVELENKTSVIIKFYRPQRWSRQAIEEEHRFCFELEDAEIPVVSPLSLGGESVFEIEGIYYSLFPKRRGHIKQELSQDEIAWMGRFVGRLHEVGQSQNYSHRPQLNVQSYGWASLNVLCQGGWMSPEREKVFYDKVSDLLKTIEDNVSKHRLSHQRIHGDLHHSNLLWTSEGPSFLDFDDSLMGPKVQDLWLLLPSKLEDSQDFLYVFRRNYEVFSEFPDGELSMIEDLRRLRMLRYAAWLANRWDDPIFPVAFPHFGSEKYFHSLLCDLLEL